MHRDILLSNSSFADSIMTRSFDRFELSSKNGLSDFRRNGICVAMLCFLKTAIDNSTCAISVSSRLPRKMRQILRGAFGERMPSYPRSLYAFFNSETALDAIYREILMRQAQESSAG